MGWPFYIKM